MVADWVIRALPGDQIERCGHVGRVEVELFALEVGEVQLELGTDVVDVGVDDAPSVGPRLPRSGQDDLTSHLVEDQALVVEGPGAEGRGLQDVAEATERVAPPLDTTSPIWWLPTVRSRRRWRLNGRHSR